MKQVLIVLLLIAFVIAIASADTIEIQANSAAAPFAQNQEDGNAGATGTMVHDDDKAYDEEMERLEKEAFGEDEEDEDEEEKKFDEEDDKLLEEHGDEDDEVEDEEYDKETVYVTTYGDERLSANLAGWQSQVDMQSKLASYFEKKNITVNFVNNEFALKNSGHGFIDSQRAGVNVLRRVPKDAPLIISISTWAYSSFLFAGLRDHDGPILLIGNWNGQFPGLVALLNLAGSMTKLDMSHSRIWSSNFEDDYFEQKMNEFFKHGDISHSKSHVTVIKKSNEAKLTRAYPDAELVAAKLAHDLQEERQFMCVLDEGCMGMENAILSAHSLAEVGFYKERLSQSALYASMLKVTDDEAAQVFSWIEKKGLQFNWGTDDATELTKEQVLSQSKMYIAAVRMAYQYNCSGIGIQYQQGLKDLVPASDLVEGLLNNAVRPPVTLSKDSSEVLFNRKPVVHFNEADEGAGVDAIITSRLLRLFDYDAATTLHDVRYGEEINGRFVWVFQISGGAPPSHFVNSYAGSSSHRQPAMYFPRGGGSLRGIGKPGRIVWSRIWEDSHGVLHADVGTGSVINLPEADRENLWKQTTYEWPFVATVLDGVNRDQFMSTQMANHIQLAYGPKDLEAFRPFVASKILTLKHMGFRVSYIGGVSLFNDPTTEI